MTGKERELRNTIDAERVEWRKAEDFFFFFFLLLTFLVFSSAQSRGHRAHSRPSFDIKRWRTREQTMTLTMVL